MHKILSLKIRRAIILDADLLFLADIRELNDIFDLFNSKQLIGLANEQQPVYRHLFRDYRQRNPWETRIGEPGFGFNTGVMLLDLDRLRMSKAYGILLQNSSLIRNLAQKYSFQGHLGDQDFYTLVSVEYSQLFYILPCEWNKQLCKWWRDQGFRNVFNQYYQCDQPIKIYHGNGNTPLPQSIAML